MPDRRSVLNLMPWLLAVLVPAGARAQTSTATLSASVLPAARLTLSTANLTFPDADPDIAGQVSPIGAPISITAKGRTSEGAQIILTLLASDDLRSGISVIPASALTWTASGAGFVGGTLNSTTAVTLGQWSTSGVRTGTQVWSFRNEWTYATGTYTVTVTYTLSAP
jgi:hypothetical protein